MVFNFRVPLNPNNSGFYWVKGYYNEFDVTKDVPFAFLEPTSTSGSRSYWTLNPILHNFFKYHNIDYKLIFKRDKKENFWYISISDKEAVRFKLCWTDAKDVVDNFGRI